MLQDFVTFHRSKDEPQRLRTEKIAERRYHEEFHREDAEPGVLSPTALQPEIHIASSSGGSRQAPMSYVLPLELETSTQNDDITDILSPSFFFLWFSLIN